MTEPTYLMCALASVPEVFTDDLFGVCSKCNIAIRYRPHQSTMDLTKICMECGVKAIEADDKPTEFGVSNETLNELNLLYGKGGHA